MEKYLIHSNELHLIDQGGIHQAVKQMVESLDMAARLTFSSDLYKAMETYFKDLDKRREINHLLSITDNTYDPTEDFGACQSVKYKS